MVRLDLGKLTHARIKARLEKRLRKLAPVYVLVSSACKVYCLKCTGCWRLIFGHYLGSSSASPRFLFWWFCVWQLVFNSWNASPLLHSFTILWCPFFLLLEREATESWFRVDMRHISSQFFSLSAREWKCLTFSGLFCDVAFDIRQALYIPLWPPCCIA